MPTKSKKLMIVDGNSLIHRGFHAIPHLSTSKGEPTNGVYGFVTIFLNAVRQLQPDYVAVAFDLEGPTFRDKLYKDYKATRVKAPQELYDQIPKVKEFVMAMNLPIFEKQGYEADDVIGTIARLASSPTPSQSPPQAGGEIQSVIVTGDLDSLQLVDDHTTVLTTKKGLSETVAYDPEAVRLRYGFRPERVVDFKALRGDASDNIPGVKGIGEKGAEELIKTFGSVEDLYKELENHSAKAKKLPEKLREKLLAHKADCFMSKKLATIETKVPITFTLSETKFGAYDATTVVKFLQSMEFKSLLSKIPRPTYPAEAPHAHESKTITRSSAEYHLVATQEELDNLAEKLSEQELVVVDTETTSTKEMEAELLGVSVSFKKGQAYYVPMTKTPVFGGTSLNTKKFEKILQNRHIKKFGHNMKYDFLVLARAGIEMAPLSFDTMIAAYLLNPGSRGYSLDDLVFTRFGYQMQPIEELIGKGKSQISMAEVPVEKVSWYSGEDADYTLRLYSELKPQIEKEKLDKVFYDIDMPLVPVLALMEKNGVLLDDSVFKKLAKRVDRDLEELEAKIHKLGQGEFNINSPQQLKEVLFVKLGISTAMIKKTKTGLSTAASELEKMREAHPIIPLIMDYRELAKLKSTYIDTLPTLINKATGRLHTSFNQTIAATGRLSSTEPNLQNIPIRTELGNKIREGFVADQGKRLLSLDYSQIELRVIAHLSGDKVMCRVFREGRDIHTATAAEVFEMPESQVGKEERRYAKVINFGVLYGLSAYGFTQQVPGVSRDKAQAFIDKYFLTYRGVKKYTEDIVVAAHRDGYVANELGRKRYLPEINSSQFQVRSAAERAAINTPIQGLAADIIKVAMINVAEKIGVENPECKMLLQVHDELLFEVAAAKVEHYGKQIKKIMEEAVSLSVPVIVEGKVGENWGEMEKIDL
ncbi:MAG: DNA polymerase I [Patescibacteria group bacterium]|nr:DNA polymerase I [Patescibacteria group bacterium]